MFQDRGGNEQWVRSRGPEGQGPRAGGTIHRKWGTDRCLGFPFESGARKKVGESSWGGRQKTEDSGVVLGGALKPCCGSGGLRLPSLNPDHAARQPSPWRLFISPLRFPRSSKGFQEVICTLDQCSLICPSHRWENRTPRG